MSNVTFDISSALVTDKAKAAVPEKVAGSKYGIFRKQPILVLGKVSRNFKDYETSSMLFQLTNAASNFVKKLTMGQLQGEYGHPMIFSEKELPRIAVVDPTKVSHAIHRVYAGETTEKGHTIVYADIEPFGPYGEYLAESFMNPNTNTAFSLRSLVSKIGQVGNVIKQRVTALITIDAVDAPGYAEASKVRVPSMEGFSMDILHPEDHLPTLAMACGFESANDQQLLDILQVDKVTVRHEITGLVDKKYSAIITPEGKKSLVHEMFK